LRRQFLAHSFLSDSGKIRHVTDYTAALFGQWHIGVIKDKDSVMNKLLIITVSIASVLTGAMTIAGAGDTGLAAQTMPVQTAQILNDAVDCDKL